MRVTPPMTLLTLLVLVMLLVMWVTVVNLLVHGTRDLVLHEPGLVARDEVDHAVALEAAAPVVLVRHTAVIRRGSDHLPLGQRVGVPALGVVESPDPGQADRQARGGQPREDQGHGEQAYVVRLNAEFHLEARVLGGELRGADRDHVLRLPEAQLEEVSVPRPELVHRVRVHLQAHVDVLELPYDVRAFGLVPPARVALAHRPLDLQYVPPVGAEGGAGVPAQGDEGGGHGDAEDLDVLRLQGKR